MATSWVVHCWRFSAILQWWNFQFRWLQGRCLWIEWYDLGLLQLANMRRIDEHVAVTIRGMLSLFQAMNERNPCRGATKMALNGVWWMHIFFLSHGAIKGTLKHWFLQFFGIEDLLKCTFEVPAVCWFGCQPALRSKLWDRKQLLLPSPDMYQKTPHWKATRIVLQWHNLRSGESILIRTRAHTSWHEKPWHQYHHMGFACMGVPQNGWLMMESPFQVDDFGVSLFQEISHMGVSQRLGCPNLNGDRLAWEWRISMGPWFFWTFTQKRSKRYWTCYFSGILLFYLLGFTLPSVLGVPNTHWTLWSDRNLPQHLGSWRLCTEACSWNSWSSEDPGLFCHTLMPHKISMGTSEILGNTEHQKKL